MTLEQELEIIRIARTVNGNKARKRSETGDMPTVMIYGCGHTATIYIYVHEAGWAPKTKADKEFWFPTDQPLGARYFNQYQEYMEELCKKRLCTPNQSRAESKPVTI